MTSETQEKVRTEGPLVRRKFNRAVLQIPRHFYQTVLQVAIYHFMY